MVLNEQELINSPNQLFIILLLRKNKLISPEIVKNAVYNFLAMVYKQLRLNKHFSIIRLLFLVFTMPNIFRTGRQRLEFQRITAQQTKVHLRLSQGSVMAHVVQILNHGWPDLSSSLCPFYLYAQRGADLGLNTCTQNN